MLTVHPARTVTVAIARRPGDVIAYASNPENLPEWSFFLSVERRGETWVVKSDEGEATIRYVPSNPYGVIDNYVRVSPELEVHAPMRVIPSGEGALVMLTVIHLPSLSEAQHLADVKKVESDLTKLKTVLERG